MNERSWSYPDAWRSVFLKLPRRNEPDASFSEIEDAILRLHALINMVVPAEDDLHPVFYEQGFQQKAESVDEPWKAPEE